jgi:hypothetical protein
MKRPSLTVIASLAAAAAFALALLIGWATAGTREDVAKAQPLPARGAVPRLVLLGSAGALPAPPRARPAAKNRTQPQSPRLIVGSG